MIHLKKCFYLLDRKKFLKKNNKNKSINFFKKKIKIFRNFKTKILSLNEKNYNI